MPQHRRGPWDQEEDKLLIQLVQDQGPTNWSRISQHMHCRSPKQCRERFLQNLRPSLNRQSISADEGLMIQRMVDEIGKRWAEIARRLGNRSDNAVKNWWNGSMNRKRRGSSTPTSSRIGSGRIGAPSTRTSNSSPSPSHSPVTPFRPSWTGSIESVIPERFFQPRRESIASVRQLSPIYHPLSINRRVETPLTSPVLSDISNVNFYGPLSVASDHNTDYSASLHTNIHSQVPPLRLGLRSQHESRRSSLRLIGNSPSCAARSLEPLSDIASKRWMVHQPTLGLRHQTIDLSKSLVHTAELPRDNRMDVNNLLS